MNNPGFSGPKERGPSPPLPILAFLLTLMFGLKMLTLLLMLTGLNVTT